MMGGIVRLKMSAAQQRSLDAALDRKTEMSLQLRIGYVLGFVFYAACFGCALFIGDTSQAKVLSALIVIFGGTFGWIVGLLLTPTKDDVKDFERIGAAILTFVTGYGVAKFDKLFASATEDGQLNEVFFGRMLLLATAFCIGAVYVFVGRRYWTEGSATSSVPR
jgi:hypothetical protein